MSDTSNIRSDFIDEAEGIILKNISNEQFGVSELAEALNMSRSNLLRKIKKDTQLSASQFIRQVRLAKGMEMLKQSTWTVSEVSYQVGFGSTSYFIKCFREQYGYSPGEVGKGTVTVEDIPVQLNVWNRYRWQIIVAISIVVMLVAALFLRESRTVIAEVEKSIAVLPFKNESSDSLNLYFVNGLMESTLNNLQKIGDLRVISRTSAEKYRNTDKGIPEIAEELNVNYLVEGSGQRIGNQVLLNVQLIEASDDRPVWVEQYSREVEDVFALQKEVAKKIAESIKAIVTPAELKQIEKIPTENLVAYDFYLQALDHSYTRTKEGLEKAVLLFEKAIDNDDSLPWPMPMPPYRIFFSMFTRKKNNIPNASTTLQTKPCFTIPDLPKASLPRHSTTCKSRSINWLYHTLRRLLNTILTHQRWFKYLRMYMQVLFPIPVNT